MKSSISQAESYEEMGEFWDTHDLADFWELTEPAEFEVDIKMNLTIKVDKAPLRTDEHGSIWVGNSRVLLDTFITAYHMGATAEEIVWQFPTLDLGDVYAVLGYYLHHQAEIDAYLSQRSEQADELRKKIEAHQGTQAGLREQLQLRLNPDRPA